MAIGKRDVARTALSNVKSLNPALHDEILDRLEAEGLLDKPSNGGTVRAAAGKGRVPMILAAAETDEKLRNTLTLASGLLRQCRTSLTDITDASGNVSLEKLNAAMKDQPMGLRFRLRGCLNACSLID